MASSTCWLGNLLHFFSYNSNQICHLIKILWWDCFQVPMDISTPGRVNCDCPLRKSSPSSILFIVSKCCARRILSSFIRLFRVHTSNTNYVYYKRVFFWCFVSGHYGYHNTQGLVLALIHLGYWQNLLQWVLRYPFSIACNH